MKHILCAALLTFASLPPAHAEPRDFGHAVKLAKVPGIELSRKQRESFRAYRSKRAYFGAFYVVPGTDDGFWTRNFHDFDVAKAAAKKGCEIVSKGGDCQLYALLYPAGIDPNAQGVKGMSHHAAKDLRTRYKREQKKGKYGAFALNKAFGFGVSFGWNTAQEAREAAIAYCKVASSKALAPLGIEARKWSNARGLERCTVINTHTP